MLKDLVKKFNLDENIQNKLILYINYLMQENQKYDLTGITDINKIISHHLEDSLNIINLSSFQNANNIVDVGTGCGVPGMILAIVFQEKNFYLIEVTKKRIKFLKEVLEILDLKNCNLYENDFKTFVRKNEEKIDLFLSRATLNINELIFIYQKEFSKQKLKYNDSKIIYWGSEKWKNNEKNQIKNNNNIKYSEYEYLIENKKRFYVQVELI